MIGLALTMRLDLVAGAFDGDARIVSKLAPLGQAESGSCTGSIGRSGCA